ncbi:MAG: hypothetical protein JNK15_00230 [Planctomycetes bacterium]|nr:hypothetical protein [Planctomycetota bacterium]
MTDPRSLARALVAFLFAFAAIIAAAPGQEKPVVPEPEEAATLQLGARELGAFAAAATKAGFPARARMVWLEVLAEYDRDFADARAALGYVKVGTAWQRDPNVLYPDQDTPNAAAAKALESRWPATAQKLAAAHRDLAVQLQAAGKSDRARHHAQRALRFAPTDAKALTLSGRTLRDGVAGDEVDLAVLQRTHTMQLAVERLSAQPVATKTTGDKLQALDALGIAHQTVQSEHFFVHGDLELEVLHAAAAWAERAVAFCGEVFAGVPGYPGNTKPVRRLVFLDDNAQWRDVVRKHAPPREVDFLLANVLSARLPEFEVANAAAPDLVYDLAVRCVAKDFGGFQSDAIEEGFSHTVVGAFFGKNLVFVVGQASEEGTVVTAREQKKLMLPDLETWRELAIELAFQDPKLTVARLARLDAAEFPNDARIMGWSFVDWCVRADPVWLRRLDAAAAKARDEAAVAGGFAESAGRPLAELEQRWRRFWRDDTPLRRTVAGRVAPLDTTSKDAAAWLAAFNQLRADCGGKPVGWSASQSLACKEHFEYLKANRDQRGAAAEHTQVAGKPNASSDGRTFAATAVVWTRDVKQAVGLWLTLPGFRDAVLNANLETVGVYGEGPLAVFDVQRGRSGKREVATQVWPEAVANGKAKAPVPAGVDVELLGPEVQALLAKDARGKQKQVGWPLTFHGYTAQIPHVACKVECQGKEVAGFLVRSHGSIGRTSAPGMWVFYAAEPWPKGVPITAKWEWTGGNHTVVFEAM